MSKEIGKAWRKSLTRAKRRACEAGEKKTTGRFPYNEFVPTRGFKNVVELSKICSQLHPLWEFDTLGDWFASDKLQNFKTCTVRQFYEWEKRYQSWQTYWKTNFSLSSKKGNLSPQKFAILSEQRLQTALRCFAKLEKNWTRQLTMNNYCDWKEWVNTFIPKHFFVIWLCKSLSVRI